MCLIKNYPPIPLWKFKCKIPFSYVWATNILLIKTKANNNKLKEKENNNNNNMHNIIKAQQIKLLLYVDHIWIVLTNNNT